MFPRHDIHAPRGNNIIRIGCHDIKKTGIIVYDTGSRAILAGLLVLVGIGIYTQYLNTPGPAPAIVEQIQERQEHAAEKSQKVRKYRPSRYLKPGSYSRQVRSAGTRHNLDPKLIHAVIEAESGGNANAVSPRGAKGLMQITPGICKRYGVRDPFDIEQNINAGCAYLAHLLEILNGDLERALAAYNCGLGRVFQNEHIPFPSETRIFVDKILSKYRLKASKSNSDQTGTRADTILNSFKLEP